MSHATPAHHAATPAHHAATPAHHAATRAPCEWLRQADGAGCLHRVAADGGGAQHGRVLPALQQLDAGHDGPVSGGVGAHRRVRVCACACFYVRQCAYLFVYVCVCVRACICVCAGGECVERDACKVLEFPAQGGPASNVPPCPARSVYKDSPITSYWGDPFHDQHGFSVFQKKFRWGRCTVVAALRCGSCSTLLSSGGSRNTLVHCGSRTALW